jgi:hypothetical protein
MILVAISRTKGRIFVYGGDLICLPLPGISIGHNSIVAGKSSAQVRKTEALAPA